MPKTWRLCSLHVKELVKWFNEGGKIPLGVVSKLRAMITRDGDEVGWTLRWGNECFKRPELDLYTYIALSLHEPAFGSVYATRSLCAGVLSGLVKIRTNAKEDKSPDPHDLDESKRILKLLPARLADWTVGRNSLIAKTGTGGRREELRDK